jgi:hypothetical protein
MFLSLRWGLLDGKKKQKEEEMKVLCLLPQEAWFRDSFYLLLLKLQQVLCFRNAYWTIRSKLHLKKD